MIILGIAIYLFIRCILTGFFTVDQNERAVKSTFGKASRLNERRTPTEVFADSLDEDEKKRYNFPLVEVIGPGLHFKLPWEKIYKTSIATETINMAFDPETPSANKNGTMLDAVTRDQLNIGLKGQIRYRVSEQNLYAFFFGIRHPLRHITGYFVSILREKLINFESPTQRAAKAEGGKSVEAHLTDTVSINDLRKNLREINDDMIKECQSSVARYGIQLEASLITEIDPPAEVESALAAINTAYNNISSEISLARASADQTIMQSRRAVEIETLKVEAELAPLLAMAKQLSDLKSKGPEVLGTFIRNVKLDTYKKAKRIILSQR